MNYLSIEQLSKRYNDKELFSNITFGIDQGQKVAVIGRNGSGKSTLLKIIAGLEDADSGTFSFKSDIKVALLSQNPNFDPKITVSKAIFEGESNLLKLIRDYHQAVFDIERGKETCLDNLLNRMDAAEAWGYESGIKQLLGKLGIYNLDQKLGELSGGQQKRVAIAKVMVTQPDFIMLDEPTNHLDIKTIEWLENYLSKGSFTILMITHDRYFLDKITNEILEIDQGEIHRYKGNYTNFLLEKDEVTKANAANLAKAKAMVKKELEWMRRQPKARGTKSKYRINAFNELKKTTQKESDDKILGINLKGDRQGKKILELKGISKKYGDKILLHQFEYTFKKGDRVGVIGANGIGKSSLLKIITGEIEPDSGHIEKGSRTKLGYYTQQEMEFTPGQKVLECVQGVAEIITLSNGSTITASQLLNQFLFTPKDQHNHIGKLSGGEKRRLQLLMMLMTNPNFIILDEPTNDFDIITLNVLEKYLDDFDGCLIIVSHDRYFLDKLVDHLFIFTDTATIEDFPGNYTDYTKNLAIKDRPQKVRNKHIEKKQKLSQGLKSNKEKRECEVLEKELIKLEEDRKNLIAQLDQAHNNLEKLQELSSQHEKVVKQIEQKEERWVELADKL